MVQYLYIFLINRVNCFHRLMKLMWVWLMRSSVCVGDCEKYLFVVMCLCLRFFNIPLFLPICACRAMVKLRRLDHCCEGNPASSYFPCRNLLTSQSHVISAILLTNLSWGQLWFVGEVFNSLCETWRLCLTSREVEVTMKDFQVLLHKLTQDYPCTFVPCWGTCSLKKACSPQFWVSRLKPGVLPMPTVQSPTFFL